MTRTTLSFLGSALILASLSGPLMTAASSPTAPAGIDRVAAEQRFAVRFCFNQYRGQQDVNQCLARYVR